MGVVVEPPSHVGCCSSVALRPAGTAPGCPDLEWDRMYGGAARVLLGGCGVGHVVSAFGRSRLWLWGYLVWCNWWVVCGGGSVVWWVLWASIS